MRTLVLKYTDSYITCEFPMSKRFVNYLKYSIPKGKRSFDGTAWKVMPSALLMLVRFGRLCFDRIDYSNLPGKLQLKIADTKCNLEFGGDVNDPRTALFVTADAPLEVIKASYKALARKYHPDVNQGDDTAMKKLNAAYGSLCGDDD